MGWSAWNFFSRDSKSGNCSLYQDQIIFNINFYNLKPFYGLPIPAHSSGHLLALLYLSRSGTHTYCTRDPVCMRTMRHSSPVEIMSFYDTCKSLTFGFPGNLYAVSCLKYSNVYIISRLIFLIKFFYPYFLQVSFDVDFIPGIYTFDGFIDQFFLCRTNPYLEAIIPIFFFIFYLYHYAWFSFDGCYIYCIAIISKYLGTTQFFSI